MFPAPGRPCARRSSPHAPLPWCRKRCRHSPKASAIRLPVISLQDSWQRGLQIVTMETGLGGCGRYQLQLSIRMMRAVLSRENGKEPLRRASFAAASRQVPRLEKSSMNTEGRVKRRRRLRPFYIFGRPILCHANCARRKRIQALSPCHSRLRERCWPQCVHGRARRRGDGLRQHRPRPCR